MKTFDFLTEPPNIFIFKKRKNKTNFGGILFLLYILVMILIALAYILDYALNEKFIYESMYVNNETDTKAFDYDNYDRLINDDELTPYLNLTLRIFFDEFGIYDDSAKKFLELDHRDAYEYSIYIVKKKVHQLDFTVFFKCGEDESCSIFKGLFEIYGRSFGEYFVIYPQYKINHFEDPPVQERYEKPVFGHGYPIDLTEIGLGYDNFEWEVIKYQDQKSLFDTLTNKKTKYIFGNLKRVELGEETYENFTDFIEYNEKVGYYIPIFKINFDKDFFRFLLYKRRKVELLDALAKIGALFSTVKYFFSLILYFYTTNFDNYEVIEKLLHKTKKPIKRIELSKEFKTSLSNEKKETNLKIIEDINKVEPLIYKNSQENENENKINIDYSGNDKDIEENKIIETSSYSLKKLYFYHFYFNNIYCKCCKTIKNQEMINITNEILYKYLSIDHLLFNQIKLENLFKDYKWNNPSFNNIQNNKMIIKLKKN